MPVTVDVVRGGIVESVHDVHVAVADARDGLVASAGDPRLVSFVRSAVKMFQVLPLVEGGGVECFGLTPEQLALCVASHNGEPGHVAHARAILRAAGVGEDALACGPQVPMHVASADALRASGQLPGRIHNNCSGKHAGMLALCRLRGWPTDGYHALSHPVQHGVQATLARWTGTDEGAIGVAVDGCGLPTFALPLAAVAAGCARFAAAAAAGDPAPAAIVEAMTRHPWCVAGTDRLCTDLMRACERRLFAKVGAEGYYCVGVPAAGLGIAIKVADGALRAVEPALLAVLLSLGIIDPGIVAALQRYAEPGVLNTRGETVGRIRARVVLERA